MQNLISIAMSSVDQSLSIFVTKFILYIPIILLALLVLGLGMYIANLVHKSFLSFFKAIKLDTLFSKIGMQKFFDEVGLHFSVSRLLSWLFKFTIDFVTILTVLSILGMTTVVRFISFGLIAFIPTLATIVVLLFITFVVANKVKEIVLHSTLVTKNFSPITARIAWLMIVVVGLLTVLDYLKIAQFLVNLMATFVTFTFAGLALGLALAFGLGAREEARCLVRGWMGKDCSDIDCGCEDEFDMNDYDEDLWEEVDDETLMDPESEIKGDIDDNVR